MAVAIFVAVVYVYLWQYGMNWFLNLLELSNTWWK